MCQIVGIRLRRVRVVARRSDVVDVKVRDTAEGPFDVLVADVIRVAAIGVCECRVACRESRRTLLVVSIEVGLVVGRVDELAVGIVIGKVDVSLVDGQCFENKGESYKFRIPSLGEWRRTSHC